MEKSSLFEVMLRVIWFLLLGLWLKGELLPFFAQVVRSIDGQPIRNIVSSSRGFLYYSTRLGIYRYDGVEHRVVVRKPLITSLIEAPTGLLFFSTRDSLFYLDSTGVVVPIRSEGRIGKAIYDVVRWGESLLFISDEALIRVSFREPGEAKLILLPRFHAGYGVVEDQFYMNIVGIGLHILDEKGAPLALVGGEVYEQTPVVAFLPGREKNQVHILQVDGSIYQFPDHKLIKRLPINFKKELFLNNFVWNDTLILLTEKFLYFISRDYRILRKIPIESDGLYLIRDHVMSLIQNDKMYFFSIKTAGFTIDDFSIKPDEIHFLRLNGGKCYIGSGKGLFLIDLGDGKRQKRLADQYITAIQFEDGQVYVSSNRGIYEVGSGGKERLLFSLPTLGFWIEEDTLIVQLVDGMYVFTPVPPKGPPYQPVHLDVSKRSYYESKLTLRDFFPPFEVGKEGYLIAKDSFLILYQPLEGIFSWVSVKDVEKVFQPYVYFNGKEWVIRNLVLGSFLHLQEEATIGQREEENKAKEGRVLVALASINKEVILPAISTGINSHEEGYSMLQLLLAFLVGLGFGIALFYLYFNKLCKSDKGQGDSEQP